MELTKRQKKLIILTINALNDVAGTMGVDSIITTSDDDGDTGLYYDDTECDLSCLADDLKIEFNF